MHHACKISGYTYILHMEYVRMKKRVLSTDRFVLGYWKDALNGFVP